MIKLDLIDRKIICELDDDCRQSKQQLARKLRISRAVVEYRINRLEKEQIIKNYITTINLNRLGYKTYKIYLRTKTENETEFENFLLQEKIVLHALKTEGSYDYSLALAVKSLAELDDFLMVIKNRFKHLILDYLVSLVVYTKIFKARKLFLGEKKQLPKILKYAGVEENAELDEKDRAILRTLSQRANLSLIELAKQNKFSLETIRYRLQQLNKTIILSNRIIINFDNLGYYHYVILIKSRSATKQDEEKIFTWSAFQDKILYCSKRIGPHDFEINIAIKNIKELNEFLKILKNEFREIIDSYEINLNTSLIKLNYVPF